MYDTLDAAMRVQQRACNARAKAHTQVTEALTKAKRRNKILSFVSFFSSVAIRTRSRLPPRRVYNIQV